MTLVIPLIFGKVDGPDPQITCDKILVAFGHNIDLELSRPNIKFAKYQGDDLIATKRDKTCQLNDRH